jgi:hypothetical protein
VGCFVLHSVCAYREDEPEVKEIGTAVGYRVEKGTERFEVPKECNGKRARAQLCQLSSRFGGASIDLKSVQIHQTSNPSKAPNRES